MFISFNTLFKNNCLSYPQRLALSYKNQVYSYKELNKLANQFAYYLKSKGVKKGTLVAIISENFLERIVAIISLWKLSAAYLPIDPNYPSTRINFILNDSKVDFVITDNEIYKKYIISRKEIAYYYTL
ncbi:MAG: AMP-binding protein [Rickettsia endosymbiont of Ixodes persulcatus]|nr:AMP-binding protein [Rickettsia endosymbiont of Ixodes persulcatus]